jgi:hypothetical protein
VARSFDSPIRFGLAAARTTLSFARMQFGREPLEHAVMFANVDLESEPPVAICLFGSMSNFTEFLGNAQALLDSGWSSSSLPEVVEFLAGRCSRPPRHKETPHWIAVEALKVAHSEGSRWNEVDPQNRRPWRRAFTFGDVPDAADWLAEIYYDVDLVAETGCTYDGFGRIVIGAPLWIAVPYLRDVRLYEDFTPGQLDSPERYFSRLGDRIRRRRDRRIQGYKRI